MLWVAMMATVMIISTHLTLLYYLGQRYGNQEAEGIKFYTFSDSLLLVLGIFCQQGKCTTVRLQNQVTKLNDRHNNTVVCCINGRIANCKYS
jgi:hypothetical protein